MSAPQERSAPHAAQSQKGGGRAAPARHVISIPKLAYLGVFMFFFCVSVPAVAWPAGLGWLLLLPIGLLVWMIRSRTTVTAEGLAAQTVFGSRRVRWEQVDGIRFPKRGWARAHLTDGTEAKLPAVGFDRVRELAAVSGGRIPDPYAGKPLGDDETADGGADTRE